MAYYILTVNLPAKFNTKGEVIWETAQPFDTLEDARSELMNLSKEAVKAFPPEQRKKWESGVHYPYTLEWGVYGDNDGNNDRHRGNGWWLFLPGAPYRVICSTNEEDYSTCPAHEGNWDHLYYKNVFAPPRSTTIPKVLFEAMEKYEGNSTNQ